ncbi:hypothetical protein [Streptomyces avermitilis]|uniref:MmyB family transcriptional regulator n=1 Tax=Streptomyces avermitilis TaxID=33903 RepID=UPI003F4D58B8
MPPPVHQGAHLDARQPNLLRYVVPALPRRAGLACVEHPEAGPLHLSYETLALPDDGHRMVVHLPADDATAAALDRLNGRRPGVLRAVRD